MILVNYEGVPIGGTLPMLLVQYNWPISALTCRPQET
jgi:hypothetical protein